MDGYIVDTSIIGQRIILDVHTAHVRTLINDAAARSVGIYTPEFSRLELINIIWKHVRRQTISARDGEILIRDIKRLPLQLISSRQYEVAAFRIGVAHDFAVYDAVHIAIAQRLRLPLITADGKQSAAAVAEGVILKPIIDFVAT
jgi:predicted nucleic acid-binding protein